MNTKRPHIFICSGVSLDGKITNYKNEQSEIAKNDEDRELVYECRAKADAVMIGGNTLILDDSKLTMKTDKWRKNRIKNGLTPEPKKVVIISDAGKINLNSDFLDTGDADKIIFTTEKTKQRKVELLSKKSKVFVLGEKKVDIRKAVYVLKKECVNNLMVEGGGELIASLFAKKLIDEAYVKIGNLLLGGRSTKTLVEGDGLDKPIPYVKFKNIKSTENYVIVHGPVAYE